MIIPIKCFTCGEVLANKYLYYCQEVRKIKKSENIDNSVLYLNQKNSVKSPEGIVLDRIGLVKCSRCGKHLIQFNILDGKPVCNKCYFGE